MENGGVGHHDGQHHQGDQRQPEVHGDHAAQGHHDHDRDPEGGHELLLEEVFDPLHVGGAALDDIPGGVLGVPSPGELLDVMINVVPGGLHQGLPRLGVEADDQIPEARGEQARRRQRRRQHPHMGAQHFDPAEALQRRQGPHGQIHLVGADDRVHRDADDLRDHQLADGEHGPGEDAYEEIFAAAPEQRAQHVCVSEPGGSRVHTGSLRKK